MTKSVVFIAAVSLITFAANAASSPASSLSTEWARDWSAKKLDVVLRLYAPQPVFLPTIGPRWEGAAALRKNFAGLLATFNPRITVHSLVSDASCALAYDGGTYDETLVPVKAGKPIHADGSYLFVFQRQPDGEWKILEQTFTSSKPLNL